jgi:serralysin
MALQTFGPNSNSIGAGVQAPLGAADDAFVAFGATVSSTNTHAIVGTGSSQAVNVQGTVMAADIGIHLGDNNNDADNHVLIGSKGYVGTIASDWAVYLQGSNSLLDNRGTIWGGGGFGVAVAGTAGTMTVLNSGTIEAFETGILQGSNTNMLVVNNSGLIRSTLNAVEGGVGVDQVTNTGLIVGNVTLFEGDDFYSGAAGHLSGKVLAGAGFDTVIGGTDNDWFDGGTENDALTGNGGADTLLGQDGNDTLNGGLGNDVLSGGNGNDTLFGGAGKDTLTGGLNNDFFVFNTALNASTNRDTVRDFNHANDTFKLENAVFTKLGAGVHALNPGFFHNGAAASDANDYIVYNKATGILSYDNDGSGSHAAIAFAILNNHPVLAANDFHVI